MRLSANRLLLGYSVVLTTVLSVLAVGEAASGPSRQSFGEIDVERINIREKDGTLRLVISNTDRMPGVVHRGTNYPHPNRRTAGMLFYNEEGTENGGLTFGGRRGEDGRVTSSGHLSFDQYEQDQVVALNQLETGGSRRAGLTISDRPDKSLPYRELGEIMTLPPEQRSPKLERLAQEGALDAKTRLFVGKTPDKAASVRLSDAQGRTRLVLQVTADGAASIRFLDAAGETVRVVEPTN